MYTTVEQLERKLKALDEQIVKKKANIKKAHRWRLHLQKGREELVAKIARTRREATNREKVARNEKIVVGLNTETCTAVAREFGISRTRVQQIRSQKRQKEKERDWRMLTDIRYLHDCISRRGPEFVERVAGIRTKKIQLLPEETREQLRERQRQLVQQALYESDPKVFRRAKKEQVLELESLVHLLRGISVEEVPLGVVLASNTRLRKAN